MKNPIAIVDADEAKDVFNQGQRSPVHDSEEWQLVMAHLPKLTLDKALRLELDEGPFPRVFRTGCLTTRSAFVSSLRTWVRRHARGVRVVTRTRNNRFFIYLVKRYEDANGKLDVSEEQVLHK